MGLMLGKIFEWASNEWANKLVVNGQFRQWDQQKRQKRSVGMDDIQYWAIYIIGEMDEEYNDDQEQYKEREDSNNQQRRRRSSIMSLDRVSGISREPSLRNKPTLVQVLSVDGSEMGDDIFEYYEFQANNRKSIFRNSGSSRMGSGNESSMDIEESREQRRSSNTGKGPRHECKCDDGNCLEYHCICSSEPNDMCLLGYCCINCIKMKNQMMTSSHVPDRDKGCLCKNTKCQKSYCKCYQMGQECNPYYCKCNGCENMSHHDKNKNPPPKKMLNRPKPLPSKNSKNSTLACSCKKSHCLKKYCCCYSSGKQCGPQCVCEECHNQYQEDEDKEEKDYERQRYGRAHDEQEEDIDQYFQEKNYQEEEMPMSMQFEHPDMKLSFQH